jgi:hypothetical protein
MLSLAQCEALFLREGKSHPNGLGVKKCKVISSHLVSCSIDEYLHTNLFFFCLFDEIL